jgi:putative ATPase
MSLFNSQQSFSPLAERLRPLDLDHYVGQKHLVGEGTLVDTILKQGTLFSMILWGPPGCGKTTLARIIAEKLNLDTHYMSAVSASVSDVRKVIEKGKTNRAYGVGTLLFLDEIHRFNKAQQDSVLHAVEAGDIVLIGATTENPSFSVISPLLSRARVLKLNQLDDDELASLLENALTGDPVFEGVTIEDEAKRALLTASSGDGRKLLNMLDASLSLGTKAISLETVHNVIKTSATYFDKKGEHHYDTISAFIKSMRGSDPNAAVYYLACMLQGGEDPLFIARRMVVFASEDVGNASPTALTLAVSTMTGVQNIGMPEARILLSQCAVFLASSPKSNASYAAINSAMDLASRESAEIPLKLRNAPTKLMAELGYKEGYKYPHDYPGSFVSEEYLPDKHKDKLFYQPTSNGSEDAISKRLAALWPKKYPQK